MIMKTYDFTETSVDLSNKYPNLEHTVVKNRLKPYPSVFNLFRKYKIWRYMAKNACDIIYDCHRDLDYTRVRNAAIVFNWFKNNVKPYTYQWLETNEAKSAYVYTFKVNDVIIGTRTVEITIQYTKSLNAERLEKECTAGTVTYLFNDCQIISVMENTLNTVKDESRGTYVTTKRRVVTSAVYRLTGKYARMFRKSFIELAESYLSCL